MPDISMCNGIGCDKRETCFRAQAKPNEWRQAYFVGSPIIKDEETGEEYCPYYWKIAEKLNGD